MGGARFDIPCTAQKKSSIAAVELPPPPAPPTTNPGDLPSLADTTTNLLTTD